MRDLREFHLSFPLGRARVSTASSLLFTRPNNSRARSLRSAEKRTSSLPITHFAENEVRRVWNQTARLLFRRSTKSDRCVRLGRPTPSGEPKGNICANLREHGEECGEKNIRTFDEKSSQNRAELSTLTAVSFFRKFSFHTVQQAKNGKNSNAPENIGNILFVAESTAVFEDRNTITSKD